MRGMPLVLALGSAVLLAPAGVHAKSARPVCNLVTDVRGDSDAGDSLDVLGADIGTAAGRITVVIRLAALSRVNPEAPSGQGWYVEWQVPGDAVPRYLGATVTPTAERFEYGHRDQFFRQDGAATGTLDEVRREIRVTAPYTAWAAPGALRTGLRLSKIVVSTHWFVGLAAADLSAGSLQPGDEARASRTFVVGTPSCIGTGR